MAQHPTSFFPRGKSPEEIISRLSKVMAPTLTELKIENRKLNQELKDMENPVSPVRMESERLTEIARRIEGASQSDIRTQAKTQEQRAEAYRKYREEELAKNKRETPDYNKAVVRELQAISFDPFGNKQFLDYNYNFENQNSKLRRQGVTN